MLADPTFDHADDDLRGGGDIDRTHPAEPT
jgi:hypothetical protein